MSILCSHSALRHFTHLAFELIATGIQRAALQRATAVMNIGTVTVTMNVKTDSSSVCDVMVLTEMEMKTIARWDHTLLKNLETMTLHLDHPQLLVECPIQ